MSWGRNEYPHLRFRPPLRRRRGRAAAYARPQGRGPLGCEALDITEIDGADDLFHPEGIIARSRGERGAVFGAHTLYAAGGSTLCIQTMVQLLAVYARSRGQRPLLLAGRSHKAFVNAAALLDVPVRWLCPAEGEAYYSRGRDPGAAGAGAGSAAGSR